MRGGFQGARLRSCWFRWCSGSWVTNQLGAAPLSTLSLRDCVPASVVMLSLSSVAANKDCDPNRRQEWISDHVPQTPSPPRKLLTIRTPQGESVGRGQSGEAPRLLQLSASVTHQLVVSPGMWSRGCGPCLPCGHWRGYRTYAPCPGVPAPGALA